MNKLICFDVDGTLVEEKSSWLMLTLALGCRAEKVIAAYKGTKNGEISNAEGERIVADLYQKTGKATKQFIQDVFDSEPLKPEAKEAIDHLKNKGYDVWLVSGAIDMRVESVAKKINADGFYANASLDFNEDGTLERIYYLGNQGKTKVKQIEELAKKYQIPINEIIFAGDSENDIDAFVATKHGIAVRPCPPELEAVAWKTIDSLLEIQNIL